MKSKKLLLSLTILLGLLSWTVKADITKTVGASGADFATLAAAFTAINANTGNAYAGAVTLQIIESTTEPAAAVQLNGGNKGVRSLSSVVPGSGFVAPKVSIVLTGAASVTTAGTLVTTVTNGMVTKIVMTGGSYTTSTGTITVAIDAPSAGGVTSTATVGTVTGANLSFTMTNGGSGYGPIATFSGGSPGSGAGLSVQIISPATVPGVTPTGVGLTVAAARPGSGYTSTPTISIPSGWGGSGASAVANLYTNYTSVNIYPTVTGKTITSSFNGNLIQLTGANNVTIDGRLRNSSGVLQAGDARDLTISNTTTSAANSANTIRFDGGASNNIVEYCNLKGSPNQDFQAIVIFGSAGNSNNTIDHNLITNYTDASRPQVSIYSGGATLDNANNTISNNLFENCMSTLLCSRAVRLVAFNSNWTISGNSFYETGTFAAASGVTGSNLNKTMIELGNSTGHTVSGNYIGGNSAQCGGTLTKIGGYDNGFNGISINNSTNPGQANSSTLYVQNNFIKNINWTNGTAATNAFNCIAIVGVGISATGNNIGDASTGAISLTPTAGGNFYGFNISNTGGGTVDCSSNIIGSITTTTNKATVYGIWSNVLINGVTSGTNTVTGNTIGNLTQSGSINASAAVVDNVVYGIRVANQGPNTVSGNTIANLVCASVTSSGGGGVFGIKIDNGTATVNGNYISKLTTPNSAGAATVKGISIDNTGIGVVATSTYSNNIISLGDNTTTSFYGISEVNAQGASTTNLYHNTIYLFGTHPAGAGAMSYALRSSNSTTYNKNFKNNIIFNARTGGTVTHYGLFATAPAAGGTFDCNYNDYFISGSNGKLGNYAGTDKTATPIVTGQTGNDAASQAVSPAFAGAAAITAGTAVAADYKPTYSTNLAGTAISGLTTDYATNTRTIPTMGAYEVSTTPSAPTITGITAGNGQLSVAFTAGATGGSAITTYKYSTDGGAHFLTRQTGTTATPIVITTSSIDGTTALANGSSYNVQIKAVNANGDGTATVSTAGTPSTTPGTPTITGISSGDGQLSVAFTAGATGGSSITSYKYALDGGSWTTRQTGTTASPIVITGLTNGTTYNVQIKAVNANGDGTETGITAGTPSTTPGAPTITGITPGDGQLSVAFATGATGGSTLTSYKYALDGGSWTTRQTGTTASPIVITGLTNGTSYNVQILAVNANGDGTATGITAGTPSTTPSAPTITGITAEDGQLSVAFTAGATGGSAITDYKYSTNGGSSFTSASTTSSPIVIAGLTNGTAYDVQLKAVNNNGDGTATSNTSGTPVSPAVTVSSNSNLSTYSPSSATDVTVSAGELTVDDNFSVKTMTVAPGAKLTLASGKTLTVVGAFTLHSDATGTATFVDNGGTVTAGSTNVEQYLTSGRNWYVSSPVSGATAAVFNPAGLSNLFYSYDEAHGSTAPWPAITNNATGLTVMKGYVANMASSGVVTFSGTLNTGAQEIGLTQTSGQVKNGFNLVGNPYPSYLDWNSITKTNMLTTMWYRTKTAGDVYTFDTYNASGNIATSNGAKAVTNLIPPMQAFWVHVEQGFASSTLSVNNAQRAHADNSSNTFKAKASIEAQSVLRLQISNGINSDQALINFNSNASNGFDSYDSPKLSNESASIPEIYTLAGTEQVVINGVNDLSQLTLGFTTGEANNFTIKASQFANFASGTQIILRDNLLNYEQDLTLADYNFYSDVTANNETRFTVLFKAPSVATGINPNTNGNVWISLANNQIVVNGANGETNVAVYNEVGQRLVSQRLTATTKSVGTFVPGVYMVTVTNAGKTITRKIIID